MRYSYKRNCDCCGKFYIGHGEKYCSKECYLSHYWGEFKRIRKEVVCKGCGKKFLAKKKEKERKFCDMACRRLFYKNNASPKKFYPDVCHAGTLQTKYSNIKRRSIDKGLDCLTSKEFVLWYQSQIKICHYCGIPQEIWEKVYKDSQFKFDLSIDRKDVGQGYLEYNMALCCGHCNVVKNNILTEQEMLEIGERYMKPKWQKKLQEVNQSV